VYGKFLLTYKSKANTIFMSSVSLSKVQRAYQLQLENGNAIERDQMTHSTYKIRLHCTYLKILNFAKFGLRSRDDYELLIL